MQDINAGEEEDHFYIPYLYSLIPSCLNQWQSPIKKQAIGNLFVCVEVLQPSQPNGIMLSAVSLPNHTFTGQA